MKTHCINRNSNLNGVFRPASADAGRPRKSKRHPALKRSLLLRILTPALLTAFVSAAGLMGLSTQASEGSISAETNIIEKDIASKTFDAVQLDYDHPPFKQGEKIPLFRISGGFVAGGDNCLGRHYHSNPDTPTVTICKPGGGIEGRYRDMNRSFCGHGEITSVEAKLEVTVEAPSRAARGGKVSYVVTVKNIGEVAFDSAEIAFNILLDALPVGRDKIEGCSNPCRSGVLEVGAEVKFEVSFTTDVTGMAQAVFRATGVLKCDQADRFFLDTSMLILNTDVIEADVGPAPSLSPGFDIDIPVGDPGQGYVELLLDGQPANGGTGNAALITDDFLYGLKRLDLNATFGPAQSFEAPVRFVGGVMADVNGDGRRDMVAFGQGYANLFTYLRGSDGRLGTPITHQTGLNIPSFSSSHAASGDIDGDGRADLIAAHDGMVQYSFGDEPVRFIRSGTTLTNINALAVTVDGLQPTLDSVTEFSSANDSSGPVVVVVCGPPSNSPPGSPGRLAILSPDADGNLIVKQSLVVGGTPSSAAFGDFDRDGNRDIAVTDSDSNTVSILQSDGDGIFGPPTVSFPTGGTNPIRIAIADINGDGKLDLAVAHEGSNDVSILQGDGTGNFFRTLSIPTGPRPVSISIGDVNDDGKLDLIMGYRGSGANPQTTELGNDSAGATVYLNDAEPVARAIVEQVEIKGKHLIVTCSGCGPGAKVLVDGVQIKKTILQPDGNLRAKKAAKQISPGQRVVVQVESDGKFSEWFIFRRPD